MKLDATVYDFLALPDADLERVDLVAMNLAAARGIESLKKLDVERYCRAVSEWAMEFARRLPAAEQFFWRKGPERWKNDIRFYRLGMLQMFLSSVVGIRYNPDEMKATSVQYIDPSSLFLNGVIDTKIGTCANMATLHVAIARRMGWPVSLALVKNHQLSRFDDGEVIYNIEPSHALDNGFSEGSDQQYMELFKMSCKAKESGMELRKLTAREMMGVFVAARARHYQDIGNTEACDVECCLARHLLPKHRPLYTMAMGPYIERGKVMFNPEEVGHPKQLYEHLATEYALQYYPAVSVGKPAEPLPALQSITRIS